MRLGFALSLTIHIALLLWAVLTFQRAKLDDVPETIAISVAVVTPSDVTRQKQGDENTKTLDSKAADKPADDNSQKEAEKPKPAPPAPAPPPPPEQPPPRPEPAKAEPPKPDPIQEKLAALPPEKAPEPPPVPPAPTPDDQAALAAKLEDERKAAAKAKADAETKAKAEAEKKRKEAEAKKKAEELRKKKLAEAAAKAKAEAEKNKFDPNKLADLINKADDGPKKPLIDKSQKPTGAKPTGNSQVASNTGPSAGTRDGRDSVLSATEKDLLNAMLKSQLEQCWNIPAGGGGAETPIVVLSWRLTEDGSLDGEPIVLSPQNTPLFQVAAEAAIRAVKKCSPFQLPRDKFQYWREIRSWKFDPSKVL